jgi:hypothetical protein
VENSWPLTFQTLLLSSFTHPDSSMSYIVANSINDFDSLLQTPDYFLGPEWGLEMFNYTDNKLNKKYFNLPEKGYRKITTSQQDFDPNDSVFNSTSIIPRESMVYATKDSILFTSVKITNLSKHVIPAIPKTADATYLCYHISDSKGVMLSWDNIRTPLEADLHELTYTGLNILTARLPKGTYTIEADLVTENKRWWGINAPFKLIVK